MEIINLQEEATALYNIAARGIHHNFTKYVFLLCFFSLKELPCVCVENNFLKKLVNISKSLITSRIKIKTIKIEESR